MEVNFEKNPEFGLVFKEDLDPVRIIRDLEVLLRQEIVPGKTLIFFDEIQECPEAIKALRYFYEEKPELHIIGAGSLLEFVFGNLSLPVGRISYEYLYPLSFREFLCATERVILADRIPLVSYDHPGFAKLSNIESNQMFKAMHEYCIVGGMPECVAVYVKTRSYASVAKIQDFLLTVFRDDIPKYARGDLQIRNVAAVFAKIFQNVGCQIKYSTLGDGDNITRTKNSVYLLAKAMLCHIVKSVDPSGLPLGASAHDKVFKLIFLDIGLGQRLSGINVNEISGSQNILKVYNGKLADQFVGQQLLAESSEASEGRDLYTWIRMEKSSGAEVDYLLSRNGKVVPVEVKSGKSGSLKSLHLLRSSYTNSLGPSFCLQHIDRPGEAEGIFFYPLFTIL